MVVAEFNVVYQPFPTKKKTQDLRTVGVPADIRTRRVTASNCFKLLLHSTVLLVYKYTCKSISLLTQLIY